jgi:hypothetical protein
VLEMRAPLKRAERACAQSHVTASATAPEAWASAGAQAVARLKGLLHQPVGMAWNVDLIRCLSGPRYVGRGKRHRGQWQATNTGQRAPEARFDQCPQLPQPSTGAQDRDAEQAEPSLDQQPAAAKSWA